MKESPREITTCNEIGLSIKSKCRLPDIHFYESDGTIYFEVTVLDTKGNEISALQYLNPNEAMKLSNAMKACAIRGLENE